MRNWKKGNSAGSGFRKNGDLWIAHWMRHHRGNQMILMTEAGFRDTQDGDREKVVLDRYFVDPPQCGPPEK